MSLQEGYGVIRIKVKNIGESTAKDVYAGAVQISYFPYDLAENYSELHNKKIEAINYAWNEGKYYFDTGIYKNQDNIRSSNLTISGVLENWDYIGDIEPSAMYQIDLPSSYYPGFTYMVAWTGDKKIHTIFEVVE